VEAVVVTTHLIERGVVIVTRTIETEIVVKGRAPEQNEVKDQVQEHQVLVAAK
jgi:hypothetical protein